MCFSSDFNLFCFRSQCETRRSTLQNSKLRHVKNNDVREEEGREGSLAGKVHW